MPPLGSRYPTMHPVKSLLTPALLGFAAASAVAQVPCSTTNLGTNLGITDETMSAAQALGFTFTYNGVSYTDVQVCDNGYVTLGASGGQANWSPSSATLTSDLFPRICPMWVDLDPGIAGNGDVYFNAVPASGSTPAYAVISWDAVVDFNSNSIPHTFQLFLIDGGQVRVHYGSDVALNSNSDSWLVGASPGNGAAANVVSFTSLPIITAGNATLHEEGSGSLSLADLTIDWLPDGVGGFIVTESTSCAGANVYGRGCIGQFASFYEHFATSPSIDLSNSAFSMINTGSSYLAIPSTTAFVTPSPTATNLQLGDDTEATINLSGPFNYAGGSTSSLTVCSNGLISTASNGNYGDFSPTPAEFLALPNTTWACWRDFVPSTTDNVWFEEANGIAYITWLNVIGWDGNAHGTTPSTLQFQFALQSGDVNVVFQSLDQVSLGYPGAPGWVVGYHSASGVLTPESIDLSTSLPVTTYTTEVAPLELAATGVPVIGSTISLDTTNIPAGAPFGAIMLGLSSYNPGIDLTSSGLAGCFRYTDSLALILFLPAGSSTASTPFTAPNLVGLVFNAQSAVYAPSAPVTTLVGALVSNGLGLRMGN
jgi:hypothetical protein